MHRGKLVGHRRDRRTGDREERVVDGIGGGGDGRRGGLEDGARVSRHRRRAVTADHPDQVANVRSSERLEVRADARHRAGVIGPVGQRDEELADQRCIHARRIIGDVRRTQAPYAITAVLVLVVSIAVLAGALAMGGLLDEHVASDASPAPSASRPAIELSSAGRLAYWRTEPNGDNQLWVSNIDGSGRHPIAKIDLLSRVSSTRWSPDGN